MSKTRNHLIDYTIPAVEVIYRGMKMRSRLEARWAAFFDLCRWRWEYEPVDFNGWFPDFVLVGEQGNMVFVEIKPIAERNAAIEEKIEASGCPAECLILGLSPLMPGGLVDYRLGWLRQVEDDSETGWWSDACLFCPRGASPLEIDFCHYDGSYRGRISGDGGGNHHLGAIAEGRLHELWGLAHEQTRFDPF